MGHLDLNIPFLVTTKGPQERSGLREARGRRAIASVLGISCQGFRVRRGLWRSGLQSLDGNSHLEKEKQDLHPPASAFQPMGTKVMVTDFKVFPDPWLLQFSESTF